ncbi:unnamed protein product [Brassicogethes aeneus]|uniref:G-protein coupled receptors family 1 profile domain-containing protein n=1 Tax=Brassicogethes aeneus TaxID=1431903 RepID=A0A9P0B0Z5_BRAAE|nr:unnamed protein product [Brassicogethes aeneus]
MVNGEWNSSYVFGVDKESGWGERFFFTYFSELNSRPIAFVALEVTIFVFIFLISIIANLSIVICVFRYPDMRTVTNCFVLNLAAADLLFAFTIPAVAYTRLVAVWTLGNAACKIVPYVQFVSGIVLLWTLALISIDRYRCIVVPPYTSKLSVGQAALYSTLIWIATVVIFIPVLLWFREITSNKGDTVCTLIFPMSDNVNYSLCFIIPVLLFACLLPMILLIFYYQRIFKKIISTKNAWATSCVMLSAIEAGDCTRGQGRRQSELSLSDIFVPWSRKFSTQYSPSSPNGSTKNTRHGSLSQHEEVRMNRHIKVVRVLFLNVLVVLIMWLPITIIMLLIYIDGRRLNDDKNYFLSSTHFIVALIIAFLNTLVNPVLYGLLSDNFRTCLIRIWCRKKENNEAMANDPVTPSSGRQNPKPPKKQSIINSVTEAQNEGP